MEAIHVIKRPILTEKGSRQAESNHYLFEVAVTARKPEIKAAVESLYNVKVVAVNTMTTRGRHRATKWGVVKPKISKKAIVRLRDGDAIELL